MTSSYFDSTTTYVDEGSSVTIKLDNSSNYDSYNGSYRFHPGDVVEAYLYPDSSFDLNTPTIPATLDNERKAAFTFNAIADNLTEGPERFIFYADEEWIVEHYIIINDTSKEQVATNPQAPSITVNGDNNVEGDNNVITTVQSSVVNGREFLSDAVDVLTGQANFNRALMGGNDFLEITGGADNFVNGNTREDHIVLHGG
ncbi:hypothetical protein [Prochlorococcus sp. MIT 1303]|uniref:hypothetical protein n=1 Tax=Prochlorococcus sp. MIT 1303 TaxID=1723647 RepID=UPI0007B3C4F5|nr:hypothetical protein [Prochlorococcus sp. MIT 1303]KZR64522.1 hypothetical protein PMIT1303_01567 [Prochlorococcus sp. MIT 1303]